MYVGINYYGFKKLGNTSNTLQNGVIFCLGHFPFKVVKTNPNDQAMFFSMRAGMCDGLGAQRDGFKSALKLIGKVYIFVYHVCILLFQKSTTLLKLVYKD